MGVTADVTVELLCMRGTLEEAMLQRQRALEVKGGGKSGGAHAVTLPVAEEDEVLAMRGAAATAAEERALRNELLLALRPVRTADLAYYWSASDDEAGSGNWRGTHTGTGSLLPELLASSAQAVPDSGTAEQASDEQDNVVQPQGWQQRQQWWEQQQRQAESAADEAAATSVAVPAVAPFPLGLGIARASAPAPAAVERSRPRRTVRFADG